MHGQVKRTRMNVAMLRIRGCGCSDSFSSRLNPLKLAPTAHVGSCVIFANTNVIIGDGKCGSSSLSVNVYLETKFYEPKDYSLVGINNFPPDRCKQARPAPPLASSMNLE